MKKSNVITFFSFLILIGVIVICMSLKKTHAKNDETEITKTTSEYLNEQEQIKTTEGNETGKNEDKVTTIKDEALFIGDSRTVGLSEYAGIKNADFYANVGMSVYNIYKKSVSVPTVGKTTLEELLSEKEYGKIYIMLGINEIGYDFDKTVDKYRNLVEFIMEKQPGSIIFIQANLHVTKKHSDNDNIVDNTKIDRFNKAISEIADNKRVYYLDANFLYDDKNGNLSSDKSGDGVHLFAKYYKEWGNWIVSKTESLLEEDKIER